jgi:hypothetical protein
MSIEGTSLSYAANTRQEVVRLDTLYYLCIQGVWFVSLDARGPWQTASTMPRVILAIQCVQLGSYNPLGNYQICAAAPPPARGLYLLN